MISSSDISIRQMKKEFVSSLMRVACGLATLGVVLIHCFAIADINNTQDWVVFEQWFVHITLLSWCVPLFFVTSGFWFGRSGYMRGELKLAEFWRKKYFIVYPLCSVYIVGLNGEIAEISV